MNPRLLCVRVGACCGSMLLGGPCGGTNQPPARDFACARSYGALYEECANRKIESAIYNTPSFLPIHLLLEQLTAKTRSFPTSIIQFFVR